MVRRSARLIGTLLCLVGLVAIAWAATTWLWQDPVTALYTQWEQRRLERELEGRLDDFAAPKKATTEVRVSARPQPSLASVATRLRRESETGAPLGKIRIPRLGINMVIVNGTDHESLKAGPGRDRRTFMPGEGELVYIAGHRTTYGAPFARIDEMRPGDAIELQMPYAKVKYRVTRHVIVPATDVARLRSPGYEILALQACHPRFSARERYIVYARPVSFTSTTR